MPFLIIGITFLILSFTTDQNSFLAIGIIFSILGAGQVKKKKDKTRQEAELENE